MGPAVGKLGTVAQTRWRRPAKCFIQVCRGTMHIINLLTHLTDQGYRSVVEPCSSLQRQLSWSLWLRLLKPVPGKCRDMSKTFSKIGVPAASLASCCHLGGEAGSDEAVKKARINGRCSPCFHPSIRCYVLTQQRQLLLRKRWR